MRVGLGQTATGRAAAWRSLAACVLAVTCVSACGDHSVPSPFSEDAGEAGAGASAADPEGGLNVGSVAADPTLGGPCTDDGQCDDGIACTADSCDTSLQRCRHSPDDSPCADAVYCNGAEMCDPKLGCTAGAPVSCSDGDSCTIDTCIELDHSCSHAPRDADGDGDPVWNCAGGGDCNDTDPTVSSKTLEVCNNGKDDNCDGQIDESPCTTPAHDTCSDPLAIVASGFSSLSLTADQLDYPTECAPTGKGFRDAVVAIVVPPGPAQDVDVVAQSNASALSLAAATSCGAATGTTCAPSFTTSAGSLSRLRLYGISPGAYTLYVAGNNPVDRSSTPDEAASTGADKGCAQDADCLGKCVNMVCVDPVTVDLAVQFLPASMPPSNETCDSAAPLMPGVSQTVSLVGTARDLSSQCDAEGDPSATLESATPSGDLVYQFTLSEARDVQIFASANDSYGVPQLSLRDEHCSARADELTCRAGSPASLFARALQAGHYYLSVSATGPSDVNLRLEESAASSAPEDEGCATAPELALSQTIDLTLSGHADAVELDCLPGAPDSTHSLTLTQSSDVLLVERISSDDTGAVSLALPTCQASTRLSCSTSTKSPVRAHAYAVAPGNYRAVAESAAGNPVSLTAFARAAQPTTVVAFADDCSAPFEIPSTGGRFQGNTANANPDYDAGCDVGNQPKGGAPDQMLHLALSAKSRVILDMAGSSYNTMLSVRSGASCPGSELQLACAAGYVPERSFLDLDLDGGDYYVQVDGYDGDSGAWTLDVYVAPSSP